MSRPVATVADPPAPSAPNGVRVQRLRTGSDEILFVLPGLDGDPEELSCLAAAFTGPQQVWALAPSLEDADGEPITTVERMAELMVDAVRTLAPSGRYRLAGYSFGALVALEMGQQLQRAGESVDALFMIEGVYDERYWPRGIWLRALARRTAWQLKRILRMPPRAAVAEADLRTRRLVKRLIRRNAHGHDPLNATDSDAPTLGLVARNAVASYQPRKYLGRLVLIASSEDNHFGCDTTVIWTGLADQLDIERVDGDHLTVMHEPTSAAAVARVIDHGLATRREGWAAFARYLGSNGR